MILDFEKSIINLEDKIKKLRNLSNLDGINITTEINRLQAKINKLLRHTYSKLTPWQKLQVARHPDRPHLSDYIERLISNFVPLAGDRYFAEDKAIIGGLGRFRGQSIMIIGHQKGHDIESRLRHNFGMAKPEGYRKASRLMKMADHFHIPILTLIDTSGAYPGIDAEARGQAVAIARSIEICINLRVPLISAIIGEGGSGGAIALAVGNVVLMLEHAIYSVISPEGCASILWRNVDAVKDATEALRITAQDLHKLAIIDEIIPEPLGGAHRNPEWTIDTLGDHIEYSLKNLILLEGGVLRSRRREKFLNMGKITLTQ
ncbi:MAG: acetyl-CoA carboxylase carboxyltransferase subunit alpha [Rhodospirillaceae bacterium]|jgi:acetyl-CoA carboxylase carboxyl transferase subunit alpha|nr:acetyl-CoA carboxylase carboxyltransferase subunit alpha [Rhodospirillaceae bacterium]